MPELLGRHYASGAPLRVRWEAGVITECALLGPDTDPDGADAEAAARAAAGPFLAPALVDVQMNGYGGLDFAAPEHVARIVALLAAHGVARFCPTVTTGTDERIGAALAAVARAREGDPATAAATPCIHLEGPYLSDREGARGAHPPECMRDPDWDHFQRLQERARGLIRLVTIAPERAGALDFIRRAVRAGIVVAIGHTAAEARAIALAADAGARMSTHLGNGLATPIDRHHNPLWPQLADERLVASFIADGHHLPAPALRAMLRAKGGPAGAVLVSDSVRAAGLPPGRYEGVGGGAVDVLPSGRIQLAGTPYLAGSGANLAECVAFAVRAGAATQGDAIDMASTGPSALLGLPGGGLRPGAPADLVAFDTGADGAWRVRLTVRDGTAVFGQVPA